jgi:hypothetical protein
MIDAFRLTLGTDGAERHIRALGEAELEMLERLFAGLPVDRAGVRLHGIARLAAALGQGSSAWRLAASAVGPAARPVRAILFDKTESANWSLAWHQDRTIPVRARVETPGFGPWTVKAGMIHVAPPFALLERMVTLRIHLDPVDAGNAPLLVAPRSHRLGRVPEPDIDRVVSQCGQAACLARRGDIWIYATPILHASDAARRPARRRVLQVDYSPDDLPDGLEWLGV